MSLDKNMNGSILVGSRNLAINDASWASILGLTNILIPGQISDIINNRPVRSLELQPVAGGDGGASGGYPNNTSYDNCNAGMSNPPCFDRGSGLIVIGNSEANGWGNEIDNGGGGSGGQAVLIPNMTGSQSLPPILKISCYAGLLSAAIGSARMVGAGLMQGLESATGGSVALGDLASVTTWSAADVLALAADAIAAIGLGGWIAIIIGVLGAAGIGYSIYKCATA
jgi:hypothetical protein